MTKYEIIL